MRICVLVYTMQNGRLAEEEGWLRVSEQFFLVFTLHIYICITRTLLVLIIMIIDNVCSPQRINVLERRAIYIFHI